MDKLPSPVTREDCLEEQRYGDFRQRVMEKVTTRKELEFFEDEDGFCLCKYSKDATLVKIVLP